eukprot:TRINITY_DN841_c0_g1_i1.p2 TRINITY_DN841_c0_g1~~TRINITY_DN841_c0_g1_i1.p2  ORF type:complete len:104 (+),score=30.79 TRINITY_DN841_c0_g1_i1:237-548(+)
MYDSLTVGGTEYCGSGTEDSPDGLEVESGTMITWSSDGGSTREGWTICLASPTGGADSSSMGDSEDGGTSMSDSMDESVTFELLGDGYCVDKKEKVPTAWPLV